MDIHATPPAPAAPPSHAALGVAGLRFAVGLGAPLAAGIVAGNPYAGGFAAIGAMFALASDTRRSLAARLGGIALAVAILTAAAVSGTLLRGDATLQ